jgi:hypothetical protein
MEVTTMNPAAWGSPIGIGILLLGLGSLLAGFGVFVYLSSLTDKKNKKQD